MNGGGHRLVSGGLWIVSSTAVGLPAWQVAAGVVPAVAFSAGPTSPDLDNQRWWKRLDKWIPDEWLGDGGPLGHRELCHWWGLPAAVAWVLWTVGGPWYAWAAVVGWAGHLLADFIVGQGGYGTQQGIPLGPWHAHVGLGAKCGGAVEWFLAPAVFAAACWYAFGGPVPSVDVGALGEFARMADAVRALAS